MVQTPEDIASILASLNDFTLFSSSSESDSDSSSTVSADSGRVLATPATTEQTAVLVDQREKLSWKQFIALLRTYECSEIIMKWNATREQKRLAATRARMADLDCLETKKLVHDNLVVQVYNKANPLQNMDHITRNDASKMLFLVDGAPTGKAQRDIFRKFIDRSVFGWKPTVQVLDEWSPDKKILEDQLKKFAAQQRYTKWALKNYRAEGKIVREALAQQESANNKLRDFMARTNIIKAKFNEERAYQEEREKRLRDAYDQEERERIEKAFAQAMKQLGVAGAVGVGSVPKAAGSKNVRP